MKRPLALTIAIATIFTFAGSSQFARRQQRQLTPEQQAQQEATTQDHQRMMKLLGITSLRQGANGSNPQAPNYANYDESKVKPYSPMPDPLTLKNGKKVTSAKVWWSR